MIITEYPYIDAKGKAHPKLKRIYSDTGCRLLQVDTNIIYPDSVIDSINSHHTYLERIEDYGESLPPEFFATEPNGEA